MNKMFTQSIFLIVFIFTHLGMSAQVRYAPAATNPFPAFVPGTTNNQFFAADFDADGDTDVVFWNGTLDHFYRNNGNGTYSLISDNMQTPFSGIRMPVFGQENTVMQDFDDDGDQDILYFDNQLNFHIYLQNTGNAFVQASNPFANFVAGSNLTSATVNQFLPGDFDNDGDVDMLYTTGSMYKYYQNNGAGTFTHYDDLSNSPFAIVPLNALPLKGLQYVVKADFDTDNDIDIYYFNPLTGVHHYLLNNNGVFNDVISPFASVIDGINGGTGTGNKFQAGDFDADGDVDLVFWTPSVNQYYANNGNGSFTFFPSFMNTPFEGVNGPVYGLNQAQITDLDNDGDIDIISNEGPAYSFLYLNGSPPKIQIFDPLNGALNVPVQKNLVLQFSTTVNTGAGNIYISKNSDNSIIETISALSTSVSGTGTNTITIDPVNNLQPATKYDILFDYNAFNDPLGRVFGILDLELRRTSDLFFTTYYSFTTVAAALPIKLKSFEANKSLSGIQLRWETALEVHAKGIEIERSKDGNLFSKIWEVPAKGKPSTYVYLDPSSVNAFAFYRLKLIDLDQTYQYSNIVRVNAVLQTSALMAYPNPVQSGGSLTVQSSYSEAQLRIIDMNGAILQNYMWRAGDLISTVGLFAGTYVLQLESNGKLEQTKIVVH